MLRAKDLEKRWGICRTTLWQWERKQIIPPSVRLGPRIKGWPEKAIEEFEANCPAALVGVGKGKE